MKLFTKFFRWRRQRRYIKGLISNSKSRINYLFLMLLAIILVHTLAMMVFENLAFSDALWLSLTTINTTGYGDVSSSTALGRSATVVLMYVVGITLMAQLATEYIEYRIEKKDQKIKGFWSWKKMNKHIVIINTPKDNPQLYLQRLVSQIKQTPKLADYPICIVTEGFSDGLPLALREFGVVHVHGDCREAEILNKANISQASQIVVISSKSTDNSSDSTTLDVLLHLQQLNTHANITVEAVKDTNRQRFLKLGANSVIRPIRAYPELIVRAMEAPGTEQILENLFSHEGDSLIRFDQVFEVNQWSDLACRLMHNGLGTALGYIDQQDKVWTNPPPFKVAKGKAVLLLVHHKHIPSEEQLRSVITTKT